MNLISYESLAQMRLSALLGDASKIELEDSGMQIAIGLGGYEQYGESHFGWRQGEMYQTAEVKLDLRIDSELPLELAKEITKALGLPIDGGMPASKLIELFGSPQRDFRLGASSRFLRFVCGDEHQYLLGCYVGDTEGLTGFFLARKDYCDAEELLQFGKSK